MLIFLIDRLKQNEYLGIMQMRVCKQTHVSVYGFVWCQAVTSMFCSKDSLK